MRTTSIIFRRELTAYFTSPVGYVIAALGLLIAGIFFQAQALGGGSKLSADVLRQFFWVMSGITMIEGLALSFWMLTLERQQNTIVLYNTSPVRDHELVIGKFLASLVFLLFMLTLSVYMPLLIKVEGKITYSQLFVGYFGLLLIGGMSLAIGMFASAIAEHVLVAIFIAAAINATMVTLFPLARELEAPLTDVFKNLDMWHVHFQGGFMKGILNLKDIVYYLAGMYFFVLLAIKTMELKRWR